MNKVVLFGLVATALCAVAAYEFASDDFNEYLADELDYYSTMDVPIPKLRFRRDEEAVSDKCRYRRKRLCCAETSIEELHEKEKEIKRECFKQVLGKEKEHRMDPFKCENIEKHKRDMICVMQCVGQKNDVLDADGDVRDAEFADFVKQSFSKDPWFAEFQDTIIETCIDEAKNATEIRDTEDKSACNPAGIKLAHCLFVQTQLNCPESEIKDTKSCSKLKERIKAKLSDGVPPPPPFLHEE
uniref:Odorant binding protein 16 n=1 Tax=Harmonia axyridis TaxID=115357 RepID=A0A8K1AM68_HARAX|nr:odorant binding protein 16 [Harmonia axyridis]